MYEAFFGLQSRPFVAGPRPESYFPGAAIEAARQVLGRCVDRAEGAGLLIGPAGTGKTLLLQVLAIQFHTKLEVALLASGRLTSRKELLQAILYELGLPYRGLDEGESRLSLIDHLSETTSDSQGLLLLVDEAHTLPIKLLEELRLITNLVRHGLPKVRLVLAGGPVLEERFAHPKLEAFNQRLAARCYLEGFERAETIAYVAEHIRAALGNPECIFSPEALEAVHRATQGIPRLINQVCDHAMILSYAGGCRQLDAHAIEEAWSDLQQLPTPWNSDSVTVASHQESAAAMIEFGSLDEDGDEPAAVPFRAGASPLETGAKQAGHEAAKASYSNLHATSDAPEANESSEADAAAADVRETDMSTMPDPTLHHYFSPSEIEPVDQVVEIEEQLAALENEFAASPPASEVDVVFPPCSDPFHDSFADEEIVVDRFAALTAATFSHRPAVASREGTDLAKLLAPYEIFPKAAPVGLAHGTSPSDALGEPRHEGGDLLVRGAAARTNAAPIAPPVEHKVAPGAHSELSAFAERMPAESTDDADIIVVESLPSEKIVSVPNPEPVARRQEYRQLFAKLRRG